MDNQKLISVGDLFKRSFELYKPRIWKMLLLGLIGWVGSIVILGFFGTMSIIALIASGGIATFNLITLLIFLVGLLLVITINLWIQVSLVYAVKEENVKSSIKDLLAMTKSRLASYYWIVFLKVVTIVAGFIVFIVPGIIFSVWFCLSQYAFVFEGSTGTKALSRSKELIKGYWWPVLGRMFILGIIAFLISSISRLGFFINSLFTMPFGIIYMYVIYEDLKRIKSI